MKSIYTFLFVLIIPFCVKAQEGYSQYYDFDQNALAFHNIILKEDTLIVFGRVNTVDIPVTGLFFGKMDTLGNLLEMKSHIDQSGGDLFFEQGADAIPTSDGGYALVGKYLGGDIKIFKLDVNGNIEFDKTYSDDNAVDLNLKRIIEVDDGFIAMGMKQTQDFIRKGYLFKTDFDGNVLWEFDFEEPQREDVFSTINKLSVDSISILGAWGLDSQVKKFKMIINLEGDIIAYNEEDSEQTTNFYSGPLLLIHNNDNSWNYLGNHILNDGVNLYGNPFIGKVDEDFNVLWRTDFGEPTSAFNEFVDIVKTPDGGLVGTGRYTAMNEDGYYIGGYTGKVNAEGDSLWSRVDTSFYSAGLNIQNYLIGIVSLPSGSTISCGAINNFELDQPKSFGWLVKIDKDGCIEPGCNPISDGVNMTQMVEAFDLYPNPVEDVLHIKGLDEFDIEIYGLKGKKYISLTSLRESEDIDVSHLTPGIYFLKMKKGNQFLTKQFVKK